MALCEALQKGSETDTSGFSGIVHNAHRGYLVASLSHQMDFERSKVLSYPKFRGPWFKDLRSKPRARSQATGAGFFRGVALWPAG